jgi:hypothetical protein
MLPYWILFGVFAVGALQTRGRVGAEATPLLALAAALTAVMIGFRFQVGGDWVNYILIFETFRYAGLEFVFEFGDPGYSLLNWLAHQFGLGIWFVNLACALIFTWALTRFAKQQPYPWLVFLLAIPYLVIVVAMGYTRQAVAIAFILIAINAHARGNFLKFVLLIIVATAFHKSAVVILPIIGISASRNRALTFLSLAALSVTLYWLFVSETMDQVTAGYLEGQLESEGALIRLLMSLGPALLFLGFQRRFGFSERERLLWRNLSVAALVGIAALILAPQMSTLLDRLALYLIPLQLVVLSRLPIVFAVRRTGGAELVLLLIAYSAAVQFVWLNYASHSVDWLPYRVYPFGPDAALVN